MIDLLSLNQAEMEDFAKKSGVPSFRGRQLFDWCHKKEVRDFSRMSNLPKNFLAELAEKSMIGTGKEVASLVSKDGTTVKFLLEFPGDIRVETVLMCYAGGGTRNRNTLCVSTQGGCAMSCKFCASTIGGLKRNLTAGEIIEQVVFANRWLKQRNYLPVSNVVYMGMGEPFQNFDAVMKSIEILNVGKNIGMRRITVSTSGLIPQIKTLAKEKSQIALAISLHAPNNELRNTLMPVNQRYPIEALMAALEEYTEATNRRVTIEYALFKGMNDHKNTAEELAALLEGRLVHVNLLQGNPVEETSLKRGELPTVKMFQKILLRHGIETTLRESKGLDIDGACGQLRGKYERNNKF